MRDPDDQQQSSGHSFNDEELGGMDDALDTDPGTEVEGFDFSASGVEDEVDPVGPAGMSAQASATRIEQIIVEAQQSARQFIDEARQQSSGLVQEADREARQRRAEMIEAARSQIEDVTIAATDMLESMNKITAQLEEVVGTLRRSGDRIRDNLDELLEAEDETEDEADDNGPERMAGGLRRFTGR